MADDRYTDDRLCYDHLHGNQELLEMQTGPSNQFLQEEEAEKEWP